jgi:hypothetical protein
MRLDKFTTTFQSALSDAQSMANGRDNPYVEPVHLLLAMLMQADGPKALLSRAGVNAAKLQAALEAELQKLPQVQGGEQVQTSRDLGALLQACEKESLKRGDQFIASEMFLLAACDSKSPIGPLVKEHGLTRKVLETAIDAVRGGQKMGDLALVDTMIKDGLWDAFHGYHMGNTAENVARQYQLTRTEQDEFAAASQHKAGEAMKAGRFKDEIAPVTVKGRKGDVVVSEDEYPKPDTSMEILGKLRPAFAKDGTVTAGNASGINDGAAALVVMSAAEAARRGVYIVSPSTLWAVLGTMRALLKDVRIRAEAGRIKAETSKLVQEVKRLDDRVKKLRSHFASAQEDLRDIEITTEKIVKAGARVDSLDVEEAP